MPVVGGPLFTLRVWGLFCPCFEKDEDKSARQSLIQLNRLGAQVDWHTTTTTKHPNKSTGQTIINATASGLVTSLFGGAGRSINDNNHPLSQRNTDQQPPTSAQLQVVDATKDSINWGEPYPQLQLVPLSPQQSSSSSDTITVPTDMSTTTTTISDGNSTNSLGGDGLFKHNAAMSYQLDIPLHHIVKVESIDPNMLVIVTRDVHSSYDHNNTATMAEKESARIAFSSSDDRDAASLDLKVLVEWNKHRQPIIEEDLSSAGVGIRQRAQKAAHFAKREIELREKKRDREKRKASHMKGTTGLKYTAMAMANQQQSGTGG
jgi:hypothetical protein